MSVKKGQNNFKKMQDKKVKENTLKIEIALSKAPKKIEKVTLSKVVKFVSNETGLHPTTIKKNDKYTEMCNQKYLLLKLNDIKKSNNSENDNELRLLKLENTNLKNQIVSLKNVISKLEENGLNNSDSSENEDYKIKFNALLNHFKDQLEITDDQVIDPYSGVRPVLICNV